MGMYKPFQRYKPPEVLNNFYKYAQNQGLELLDDDKRWIASITYGFRDELIRTLLMPYIATWKKGMLKEEVEHKKQNTGRKLANTELRMKINETKSSIS